MATDLWERLVEVSRDFTARHGTTLPDTLPWAVWTAQGSEYLEKLDANCDFNGVVDIAHVRWATGNAITAVDLCAAAMGRQFCGHRGRNELDMRDFDPAVARSARQQTAVAGRRARLRREFVTSWPQ